MTNENRKRLVNIAAQQAEDGFAQFGIHLDVDEFNELHDFIELLLARIMEGGGARGFY